LASNDILQRYLEEQFQRRQRQLSPEYQESLGRERMARGGVEREAALGTALMSAASSLAPPGVPRGAPVVADFATRLAQARRAEGGAESYQPVAPDVVPLLLRQQLAREEAGVKATEKREAATAKATEKREAATAEAGKEAKETEKAEFERKVKLTGLELDVQRQLQATPEYKRYSEVSIAARTIGDLVDNPGKYADRALMFNMMKTLDPGSVVRKEDQDTFTSTASVSDRMANQLNTWVKGESLNPQQRAEIKDVATRLLTHGKSSYEQVRNPIVGRLGRLGDAVDLAKIDPASEKILADEDFIAKKKAKILPGDAGTAIAAPAEKDPDQMTDEEVEAEIRRLGGG
jgi:hypothetical protein